MKVYRSIADMKQANADEGGNWFSTDTMRFFNSRIESRIPIRGRFFVTSERPEDDDPRRYTIREARSDGTVTIRGEFLQYGHYLDATMAARQMEPSDE